MCAQVTKTANRFEISSLLEKILLNRLISRRVRQWPFSTAGALRGNLAFGGHISTRIVIKRLHHQGMRAAPYQTNRK
jgi:hypothetical protein